MLLISDRQMVFISTKSYRFIFIVQKKILRSDLNTSIYSMDAISNISALSLMFKYPFIPASAWHSPKVGPMSAHCLQHWPNIGLLAFALGQKKAYHPQKSCYCYINLHYINWFTLVELTSAGLMLHYVTFHHVINDNALNGLRQWNLNHGNTPRKKHIYQHLRPRRHYCISSLPCCRLFILGALNC